MDENQNLETQMTEEERRKKEFLEKMESGKENKAAFKQKYKEFKIHACLAYLWPIIAYAVLSDLLSNPIAEFLLVIIWIVGIYYHKKKWSEDGVYAAFICREKYGWKPEKHWIWKIKL